MKEMFAKFKDLPVSVRVSAVFLSVVISLIVFITAVNAPLLLVCIILALGSVASAIRLLIYIEEGK